MLAEEGIELNAVEYQRQVEEREAQRRQEREERLAREAMMTLQAMEQEEQKAAVATVAAVATASISNEGTTRNVAMLSELAGNVSKVTKRSFVLLSNGSNYETLVVTPLSPLSNDVQPLDLNSNHAVMPPPSLLYPSSR